VQREERQAQSTDDWAWPCMMQPFPTKCKTLQTLAHKQHTKRKPAMSNSGLPVVDVSTGRTHQVGNGGDCIFGVVKFVERLQLNERRRLLGRLKVLPEAFVVS
jgi:hypothetical protein